MHFAEATCYQMGYSTATLSTYTTTEIMHAGRFLSFNIGDWRLSRALGVWRFLLYHRRLLLGQAMKRAQPPNQFAAIDSDHLAIRE